MLESFLKLALIMLLLIFIYCLKDRDCAETAPMFKDPKWDLAAAYKVYIPCQLLLFVLHMWILKGLLSYFHTHHVLLGTVLYIPVIMIYLLFFFLIKRPFNVQWIDIGINIKSFTNKAIPTLLFIMAMYVIYILIKGQPVVVQHLHTKMVILPALLLASILEELLFRSILWHAFSKKMNIYGSFNFIYLLEFLALRCFFAWQSWFCVFWSIAFLDVFQKQDYSCANDHTCFN